MSASDEKKPKVEAGVSSAPAEKPIATGKGFKVLLGPIEFSGPDGRMKASDGDIVQLNGEDAKQMLSLGAVEVA